MRKNLVLGIVAIAALTALDATAGAGAQRYVQVCLLATLPGNSCQGHLEFDAGGSITPRKRPVRERVAVDLEIRSDVTTENDSHPSALREAIVQVDEGVAVDTTGLPVCRLRQLESMGVAKVRRKCRGAIVGEGSARIGFASSGTSFTTPLTLFNGGTAEGVTRLFVYGSAAAPDPIPLVATAMIRRRQAGLEGVWRIPPILDGDGSLLDFEFRIGRRFVRGRTERSYLASNCRDGAIRADVSRLLFRNEAEAPGVAAQTMPKGSLALPCTPDRQP